MFECSKMPRHCCAERFGDKRKVSRTHYQFYGISVSFFDGNGKHFHSLFLLEIFRGFDFSRIADSRAHSFWQDRWQLTRSPVNVVMEAPIALYFILGKTCFHVNRVHLLFADIHFWYTYLLISRASTDAQTLSFGKIRMRIDDGQDTQAFVQPYFRWARSRPMGPASCQVWSKVAVCRLHSIAMRQTYEIDTTQQKRGECLLE